MYLWGGTLYFDATVYYTVPATSILLIASW